MAQDFENPLDVDEDNVYEVEVSVTDEGGNAGVITINVTVIDEIENELVRAIDDPDVETEQDVSVIALIYENDFNIPSEGTLITTNPENGAVTINDNNTPNNPSDDIVTYTPNNGFVGEDTFEYTVCVASDAQNCSTATVTITIALPLQENSNPIAVDDAQEIPNGENVTIDVLENDTDLDNDILTVIEINEEPISLVDSVTLDDGTEISLNNDGTLNINTPLLESQGSIVFNYTVSDGNGGEDDAVVTISVVVEEDESGDLVFYNAVSPEKGFVIENIDTLRSNNLRIYNRWGVLVFEQENYSNDEEDLFKGISAGRVTIAQKNELPVGTYFYVFDYVKSTGESNSKVGHLYLNRI